MQCFRRCVNSWPLSKLGGEWGGHYSLDWTRPEFDPSTNPAFFSCDPFEDKQVPVEVVGDPRDRTFLDFHNVEVFAHLHWLFGGERDGPPLENRFCSHLIVTLFSLELLFTLAVHVCVPDAKIRERCFIEVVQQREVVYDTILGTTRGVKAFRRPSVLS